MVHVIWVADFDLLRVSVANVRGGKRKLATTEENSDAVKVAENSGKSEEGKVTETKRPKRQAAAVDKAPDKAKVMVVYAVDDKS